MGVIVGVGVPVAVGSARVGVGVGVGVNVRVMLGVGVNISGRKIMLPVVTLARSMPQLPRCSSNRVRPALVESWTRFSPGLRM